MRYFTGDRAYRDSERYLWFVGSRDDVINSIGYRIGESVHAKDYVRSRWNLRSSSIRLPSSLTVHARRVVDQGPAARENLTKELQDFCKKHAVPYKYPRKIEYVDAAFLPKTISGKIKRAELKKLERARYVKEIRDKL
ncbi:uncharacterized protein PV07_00190 [Cladophialophora immunda]|uniref:AMP-binding enzyme C-terminal domain-containing protein n=1 Tax=Cladophialophora immunda TaxID=569365 RepID=A0A0D2CQ18_9EURO|nr:uncharacterized protein PV07_00190 [Cladophialophora immunda]KIW33333.1 hypothetical protein PV07_00190 [Cladophialophora immunda]